MLSAAELASMQSTVSASLDVTLPVYRKTVGPDSWGHDTETYPGTPTHSIACSIIRPTATVLQVYAGIIGSKRAFTIRVMQSADILEGDQIQYDNLKWRVNNLLDAESYTVTKEYLITVVA